MRPQEAKSSVKNIFESCFRKINAIHGPLRLSITTVYSMLLSVVLCKAIHVAIHEAYRIVSHLRTHIFCKDENICKVPLEEDLSVAGI